MNSVVLSLVFSVFIAGISSEKVTFEGNCPEVAFVSDFDSEKFFGKWYAVKETGKDIPCVHYDWEETRPNHYHGYVSPQNKTIEFDKINAEDFSEGLKVNFEVNPEIHEGVAKVFATDYEHYAGFFICKQAEGVHYQFVSYWSRSPVLAEEYLTILSDIVSTYPVIDSSYIKAVKQDNCEVTL